MPDEPMPDEPTPDEPTPPAPGLPELTRHEREAEVQAEPDEGGGEVQAEPDERAAEMRPAPDEPARVVEGPAPVPDEGTLARVAEPATVRRAPKYGAFVGAGVLVGVVLGVVLATVLDTGALADAGGVLPVLAGANGARAVSALALGGLGALVGAALALWADARSRRRPR